MTEARPRDRLTLIAQSVAALAAALAELRSISATGTEIYTRAALQALAAAGAQLDPTPPAPAIVPSPSPSPSPSLMSPPRWRRRRRS